MHLLTGAAATVLAVVTVLSWIAIGSLFVDRAQTDDSLDVAAPLLVGSALTAFLLAISTRMGWVTSGAIAVSSVSGIVLVLRRRAVNGMIRSALSPWGRVLDRPLDRVMLAVIAAVLWASAISPPRNADAMRYHLAHIRQIVSDGRWTSIPDYHYALPFGWTLNFLPFELIGLPQAAQLLSIVLLVLMTAGLLEIAGTRSTSRLPFYVVLVLVAHAFVLRTFAEPTADAYAIFAMYVIAAMVVRFEGISARDAAITGFAVWIGMQSRYQLAAAGLVATILFVAAVKSDTRRTRLLGALALGTICAVALASPFYIANLTAFANPFWPLAATADSYAGVLAGEYTESLGGKRGFAALRHGIARLMTELPVAPLPLLTVIATIIGATVARREIRRLAFFSGGFLLLWAVAQPGLYPRFILLLLPFVVLIAADLTKKIVRPALRIVADRVLRTALGVLALAFVATSWDYLSYAITGDKGRYHRFTWFYPVYRWVNAATPDSSSFLVIVRSGHTYYLDRPYRRADPWLSGVVDWPSVKSGADLSRVLDEKQLDHVIYENRDWSAYRGGKEMQHAVSEAIAAGALTPIRSFQVPLYSSRVRRRYNTTEVIVMERQQAAVSR